ncbi:nitrate/nitrite transport system permease protein [Oceanisphaera litoralis]|uniref:ABC transporter permease n=1 Tax=Oceanisphaera litoralis TaxID=225144 RepID=UPI001956577E|nr:ABC transporter permease [Oceanisphaera litoralis]MBM7455361.1 nitrate/nitrite transport system permease protein [Oceanisphaera litoralis]
MINIITLSRLSGLSSPHRLSRTLIPLLGITGFLLLWHLLAAQVTTSLGTLPGPVQTGQQFSNLVQEHQAERDRERAFYDRQIARNLAIKAENPDAKVKVRGFTGRPTFFDQILTSLKTVAAGFVLAMAIAIPAGIALGLNRSLHQALNPVVQLLKPVSPLAWLPLVTIVVSALYVSPEPLVSKSFLISLVTVTLCSLWPMLINTAVGVANMDQDLVNVSKMLRLPGLTHVRKIVLPSAIPMIFTGMRLSLGVAWMVLIAAEMLAQNPGLGKFVWDEFQNGSSDSMARIMVAVVVIGLIGYLLDRLMLALQQRLSWDKSSASR